MLSDWTAPPIPPVLNPDAVELEQLGERIAELSAQLAAATYQLLTLIREFDERGGWGSYGSACRSCAHWLNWRTGLALGAAREKVRVARALADLPAISEAMSRGEISYSKVRAMTRVATPENEEDLLSLARSGTAAHVERAVRAWRRVDRSQAVRRDELRHASRYFQAYPDEDGMVVVRARLEPESGATLMRALEAATDQLYEQQRSGGAGSHDDLPPAQRRADAIGRVAEAALGGGLNESATGGSRGDRYQVVVHVDAPVLAGAGEDSDSPGVSSLEGSDVPAETSRRLACDASLVVMTHDADGKTLDVGRKTRAVSPSLRRALLHRDQNCRFPGCESRFCEAHHIHHWAAGGETNLDNLVLLCRRHHRCVHEEGYRAEPGTEGVLRFFRPDGREVPEAPPMPDVSPDALAGLQNMLSQVGIQIDPTAGLPGWDGGRMDLQAALDWLLPIGREGEA